jgi:hypothetical protein
MLQGKLVVGATLLCGLAVLSPPQAEAVLGIPDEVPAATLVVPLLEAGIAFDQNTLFVANNVCNAEIILHWEVWNVEGLRVELSGNRVLKPYEAWVTDFKTILQGATAGELTQLTDSAFYRGFLTVDIVSSSTSLPPTDSSYPFASSNCLKGTIYYVRLSAGAANGIPAVHIEGGVSGAL